MEGSVRRLLGPLLCASLLFLLVDSVLFQTHTVDIEVKDEKNVTCLIAKWKMSFSVAYETETNVYKDASFTFPDDLTYAGSTCGNATYGPVLAIEFGKGHSWMIVFNKTDDSYKGNIIFIYNTDDTTLFPDAKRKGPITVLATYPDRHSIPMHTTFSCQSAVSIASGYVVQTFWNLTLEAYVENNTLSEVVTQCHNDIYPAESTPNAITVVIPVADTTIPVITTTTTTTTTTTEPTTTTTMTTTTEPTTTTTTTTTEPTTTTTEETTTEETTTEETTTTTATTTTTTASTITRTTNTTATSTEATTNATTEPPKPLPTAMPGEKPTTGNYSVKINGTTCLLANLGLQLNISRETEGRLIMNINPSSTVASGSCTDRTAVLHLNHANNTMIEFRFGVTQDAPEKFYLKEVNITVLDRYHKTRLHAHNDSLDNWKAFLGSSYMCQNHQILTLSRTFSMNTFDVWVQPFQVKENAFATADECLLDDDAIIIPIAVGAALGTLIVLIVIAYVIGRRKSQVGYQTL